MTDETKGPPPTKEEIEKAAKAAKSNEKLDGLLEEMNAALDDRLEGNLTVGDPYWGARNAYQKALAEANGVHVPREDRETSEPKKGLPGQGLPGDRPGDWLKPDNELPQSPQPKDPLEGFNQ